MYPSNFSYYAPTEVEEAVKLVSQFKGDAKVLAGGMSLVPMMKLRVFSPEVLVDINGIGSLKEIKIEGKDLVIGAMATDYAISTSGLVSENIPLISQVAGCIGDPQVRNRGTMGGSLCHADPSGDWGACLLALRGKVQAVSQNGKRSLDSDSFFIDSFSTSLREDEILQSISFKMPQPGSGHSYIKLERKAGDFATVAVAVQLSLDKGGTCTYAGIGMAAVDSRPIRAAKAELRLLGSKVTAQAIEESAGMATKECNPIDDPLRGSAEFKRAMVKVSVKKALAEAFKNAMEAI